MTSNFKTNDKGYIMFDSRNFRYAGDKMTWAKIEYDHITVKKAARGIISSAYTEELRALCEQFGQDFDAIPCGESLTFPVIELVEEQEDAQAEQTYIVTADTVNGICLVGSFEDCTDSEFFPAADFTFWLPRLADGDCMCTELTREQAEALDEEYGIHGFKA